MEGDPMTEYLLVKSALRALKLNSGTKLGYTANAEDEQDGYDAYGGSGEDHDVSMEELAFAVQALNVGGVPFAVGGLVELCESVPKRWQGARARRRFRPAAALHHGQVRRLSRGSDVLSLGGCDVLPLGGGVTCCPLGNCNLLPFERS